MRSETGLRARGLVKRFRGTVVLDGVDIDVDPGGIVALTGANGAGKTTVLRIFATLLRADAGTATVDGNDVVKQDDAVRRSIGVALVNERAMYWRLSGLDNLRFFARTAGLSRKEAAGRCEEALALVGLSDVAARRVAGYSAGQRQRLNLARAVLSRPAVLLVDEPMRGLDQSGIDLVRGMLRAEAARGVAVLVAGPVISEFDDLCDAVLELRAGRAVDRRSPALAGDAP